MSTGTRMVKTLYMLARILVPFNLRVSVKKILNKTKQGRNLLEKLDQTSYFSQSKITFNIAGYDLLIPKRHHIIVIREREPFRENLLARASTVLLRHTDDNFIDVGANVGDTAAVIYANATASPSSILIEPSEFFFGFLKANQHLFPKSLILQEFVAIEYPLRNTNGSLHHWGGTAKFIESKLNNSFNQISQIDLASIIDKNVRLVKIDCDGFDFKILNSVIPRIQPHRPAFYYENEITTLDHLSEAVEVIKNFKKAGYKYVIAARNCGILIYGGEINSSLQDIFDLQFLLYSNKLRSALYYTDILVFHASQEDEFVATLKLVRDSQHKKINSSQLAD